MFAERIRRIEKVPTQRVQSFFIHRGAPVIVALLRTTMQRTLRSTATTLKQTYIQEHARGQRSTAPSVCIPLTELTRRVRPLYTGTRCRRLQALPVSPLWRLLLRPVRLTQSCRRVRHEGLLGRAARYRLDLGSGANLASAIMVARCSSSLSL